MFKNYLKIAWRNLWNNKGYTAINVGGLAMGMAVTLIIGLWIQDELSHNNYFSKKEKIAQVSGKVFKVLLCRQFQTSGHVILEHIKIFKVQGQEPFQNRKFHAVRSSGNVGS
mgnify:CR=1 FL=1